MQSAADSFETSPQQEALWLAEPDGPSSRVQAVVSLRGELDPAALRAAVATAVQRHEILRTTFVRQAGIRVPLQVVHERLEPVWNEIALGTEDPAGVAELCAQERAATIDPSADSPLRAALIRAAQTSHHLVLTASGLAADAPSIGALAREALERYLGHPIAVEDPLQYADYAAWQRELAVADDDERRAGLAFWNEAAPLRSPLPPLVGTEAGATTIVELHVEAELAAGLAEQAERIGASAPAVVQAAWQVLLARLRGEETATVAYVAAERRHADLEGAIGAFSRPVPVTVRAAAGVTFAEVVAEVQGGREQALARQDYAPTHGLPDLVVGFTAWEPFTIMAPSLTAALTDVAVHDPAQTLALLCGAQGTTLHLALAHRLDPARRHEAERLAEELQAVLRGAAASFDRAVDALPVIGPREREEVLHGFNATETPVGAELVHELAARYAAERPDGVAVSDGELELSWRELEVRANQLAHRLRRAGVGPGGAAGLCTERSAEMLVGLLGILKAGAAYVPVHHEHPPARLAHQLRSAGARVLVTRTGLLDRFAQFEGERVCLDSDRSALDGEPAEPPAGGAGPDDLAYVIYTSGSTGTPKGVGVTHANLRNYANFIVHRLGADAAPLTFGMVTALSTDLGNTAVYGALASGGTLAVIDPATAADAGALARRFARTPVDVLKITPSHLGALIAGREPGVLPRRTLVLGGERAPWDLVARVRELAPELELVNHYGPTEATIGCATYTIGAPPEDRGPASVPIGRPIANTAIYLLDELGEPVPIGVAGRLQVAGAGVASGYIGAPELTAERFRDDSLGGRGRMYDTGDLARWWPDGTLEFLGRVDEQVKIRGYRVEPAEVEVALRSHSRVREAVVVARSGPAADAQLIAYCVLDGPVGEPELRTHLADWVPEYMLPAAIVALDALPQTPSGKVDRLALPDPATSVSTAEEDYLAPRTPMEEALAGIWSRVLGLERVGVEDDFFALGGHSLLATQVVAQVRSDFAVDLPLHSLFTYPTVATLSAEIVTMIGSSEEEETARLMAELEALSDEEAARLLAGESPDA